MAKIVVDTPTREGLGFQDYADALVKIIVDSGSPFTIGILGEWGVGKTSLMQTMLGKLEDKHEKKVIPIWFNAWRCERERNLAIIPLLQLLVSEIKDKNLKKAFIEILKSLQLKFALPGGAELSAGGLSQNQFGEDLYYAELAAIETSLKETDKKIVVFIDDLDRCAPDKILEVLESTKVFLDIKGFVYVLGLSPEVVVKAIEQKYEDMGINGEDYLEKIVQIPFRIPDWNVTDRGNFIADLVDKKNDKIDKEYKDIIGEYKYIIEEAIERTPRQVKRFINTYICEQEVFQGKGLNKKIHLVLTILKFKWYDFYQNLFNESYRQNLKRIISDKSELTEELKDKDGLFEFINSSKARKTIETIIGMSDTDLSKYRRAGMIIPPKISEPVTFREKFIELLKAGKVSAFNTLRYSKSIEEIDLSWADLSKADLSKADLSKADLRGANLRSGIILIKEQYYQEAKVSAANFEDALISDRGFLEYLRENCAINVPAEVSTKDDFINAMKQRGLDIGDIEHFFDE
ncbi:putative P-loop ATPase [Candidatus Methanophagaceae archaeon]|nr:putative P-loop ATPase [Methanophagales archaeon]